MNRLCLLFLLISATAAHAEVLESLDFQEYVVRVGNERSLLAALNSASPVNRGGRTYHGYTTWNVRWNFRWKFDRNGLCKITDSKVNISGIILLPKLIGGASAQQDQFGRYLRNLRIHELGHFDIGKRTASAIDSYLLSLPSRNNCSLLESEANEGAYRLLEKHKKIETQYDVDTSHGKAQGAWLSY